MASSREIYRLTNLLKYKPSEALVEVTKNENVYLSYKTMHIYVKKDNQIQKL